MSYTISAPRCMYCQKSATIGLTPDEQMRYEQLQRGKITHIQDALPEWSADKRELLITGTHPECWDAIFEDVDEEEDDYDREDELEDDEDE